MIFASSPPSSITTSVSGLKVSIAFVDDITSCTNFKPKYLEISIPPEPVTTVEILISPSFSYTSVKTSLTAFFTSEKCLVYFLNITCGFFIF